MIRRWLLAASMIAGAVLIGATAPVRTLSVVSFLDRYAAGEFEAVSAELAGDIDFEQLLEQLKVDGPKWIAAAAPEAKARRELVAATFALEAARADAWDEWRWIQKQPEFNGIQLLNVLIWKPPPLLLEWACELFRRDETPRPIERWWQLAALSVAQRAEDTHFLVGDPAIGRGVGAGEIMNTQIEIKHLDHVAKRFPKEARFMLAQGIARDRVWHDDALQAYTAVANDPDVGGEAAMRLGVMQMYRRQLDLAMTGFDRAELLTRDPYVVYLARFFRAQVLEARGSGDRVEANYRGAVAAVPHAQSATLALAALAVPRRPSCGSAGPGGRDAGRAAAAGRSVARVRPCR